MLSVRPPGHICSVMCSDSDKYISNTGRSRILSHLSVFCVCYFFFFKFLPCQQNNVLFSHSVMQQKLRGGGGTMTLYIRFERTAQLSLLAMTTCNSTDTCFFFFLAFILSLCVPAASALHHIYQHSDISLPKACGSALKSNTTLYLLFV